MLTRYVELDLRSLVVRTRILWVEIKGSRSKWTSKIDRAKLTDRNWTVKNWPIEIERSKNDRIFITLAMSSNLMMGSKIRKNYLLSRFGRIEILKNYKIVKKKFLFPSEKKISGRDKKYNLIGWQFPAVIVWNWRARIIFDWWPFGAL